MAIKFFPFGISPNTDFQIISNVNDLPQPSIGVITLEANTTYYFTAEVDLLGNRLVGAQNTTILGPTSEIARIKSTGLVGTALISSEYSLPIRHITLEADTLLNLDATANPFQALDWYGINFVSPNIGLIKNYTNFVASSLALLGSGGLVFDGTFGTIAITETLLSGVAGSTTISIPATATIERRFRINNCSVICPATSSGLDVSLSASIPPEGYILDKVNFSGAGTYTDGVLYTDNKARWEGCRGVGNSAAITGYYMHGNASPTPIASVGVPVKVVGTTTEITTSQRFSVTDNRADYVGSLDRDFNISVIVSVASGNGHQVGVYIAKNGVPLDESEAYMTTNASGRVENAACQVVTGLTTGDYIEIFTENNTAVSDVTVEDMNVLIQALN